MNQVLLLFKIISCRKWILLVFLISISSIIRAQSDLINGTIVTVQGETLSVKIKPSQTDKLAKGISIYNDTTEEYTKLTPKDISYFKYNDSEYFAKTVDGKLVFMEREIDGPAQLYTYTYKVEKGNDRVEVVDYYVEKRDVGTFKLMNKKTFKNEMADFYSDDESLSEKIKEGYYSYDEKEATVEEYNDWVAQGKPGKTWTKENGNYTKVNGNENNNNNNSNNTNNNNNQKNDNSTNTFYDGSKFGIEIPLLADYSIISNDPLVTQLGVKNSSNGFGYNLGIGLRWQLTKSIFWRNGINFRLKRFHSNYSAQDTTGNQYNVDEYGNLHYFGIYSMLNFELGNFLFGAGFDISFANIYRADYSIKNNSGQVVNNDQNQPTSIIAQKNNKNNFNGQFDFNLLLGYKIRMANGAFNLKPIFQYSIPLLSMFDIPISSTGPSYYNRTGVQGSLISLGVIIDIGFPPKPKAKSLLED